MNSSFKNQAKTLFAILFSISLLFFISGCDDAGSSSPNNNLTFSISGFGQLNTATDGMYEAWVYFGDPYNYYISCGKFNIDAQGNVVDQNGNAKTLKLGWRPYDFNTAKYGLISIDPPSFSDTSAPPIKLVIVAGDVSISGDTLTSVMSMSHPKAMGNVVNMFSASTSSFMLYTPTDTTQVHWFNGIWFCGTDTVSSIVNLPILPDSLSWHYRAWIYDGYGHTYSDIGVFLNPYGADYDGAGQYKGPGNGFPRPGQDWITGGTINDLRNAFYAVIICLEPVNPAYPNGFSSHFMQIYYGATGTTPLPTMGELKPIQNKSANLPAATMKIGNLTQ